MNRDDKLRAAIAEAKRLMNRAGTALHHTGEYGEAKYFAAAKWASMDLTRSLAILRSSKP